MAKISFEEGACGVSAAASENETRLGCTLMRGEITAYANRIRDEKVKSMFLTCFYSSLDTAAQTLSDGTTFMLTGDIPAMWLRDSAVQVMGYLPFCRKDGDADRLIRGLLKRQFRYILLDPYANAFNREPNNHGHKDDLTDFDSPWIWERKYEIDSLCYPLWLAQKYSVLTGDFSVYDNEAVEAVGRILDTFETEQHHAEKSAYVHLRPKYPQFPTLQNNGKGNPVGYTGMIFSGYRPSDDVCDYGYLIPSNQFAVVVLKYLLENASAAGIVQYKDRMQKLYDGITDGIKRYAVVKHEKYGEIYAFETDGLGNYNLMDDANVPSLLSLPYLGYCDANDPIYCNTRQFILSKDNPYYYEGDCAKGVGSPHTPQRYVWHIGLIMQLLTSRNKEERQSLMATLLATDAGTGVMHEAFDCDNPLRFTREWFCWANTLFAMAVVSMLDGGENI